MIIKALTIVAAALAVSPARAINKCTPPAGLIAFQHMDIPTDETDMEIMGHAQWMGARL